MSVTTIHPLYAEFAPIVKLTRDAVKGNPAIKAAGVTYLPADFSESDPDRYIVYKGRAYFVGFTGQTQAATIGMVFRKPAVVELSPQLEALTDNIDGSGQSLDQVGKYAVKEVEEAGRLCFLADYPSAEEGLTKSREAELGLRAYMSTYTFESFINWKTETIGGRDTLTLVVLKESVEDPKNTDEFSHELKDQYRVLRLVDGVYTQQLYDDANTPIGEQWTPLQAGRKLDHIPFYIAGALNNLPNPDMPTLYDIAVVNVSHYTNTADLEESSFMMSQPHIHMNIGTDTDIDNYNTLNPNGLVYGARSGSITMGGSMDLLQANENNLAAKLMLEKEDRMKALGARMVQDGGQAETAEAARINASAQTSTLSTVVLNVGDAMSQCLVDMALFMKAGDKASYTLNQDFWEASLNPQLVTAITGLKSIGTIATTDVLYMLRNGKIGLDPDRTDKMIMEDSANELIDG